MGEEVNRGRPLRYSDGEACTSRVPGQKRQRMRMRGTKQANLDTQKRLRKNLDKLLEEGETLLPAMTWTGKLKWGRTDPVTKDSQRIEKNSG